MTRIIIRILFGYIFAAILRSVEKRVGVFGLILVCLFVASSVAVLPFALRLIVALSYQR